MKARGTGRPTSQPYPALSRKSPQKIPLLTICFCLILQVNVTADHRHINGDKAAEFLQTLKTVIEKPAGLVTA